MIGLIEEHEKKAFVGIWSQAFGDTQEYVHRFLTLSGATNYVYREDGRVLGIVSVFDVTANGKKGGYIYALAVEKNHRGRGIASRLLEYVDRTLVNQGFSFALVVPEPYDALKSFYNSRGFDNEIHLSTTELEKTEQNSDFEIQKTTSKEIFNIWKSRKSTVCHGESFFNYVCNDLTNDGAHLVKISNDNQSAFCICHNKADCVIINEITGCKSVADISQAIMKAFFADKAIYVSLDGTQKHSYALLKKYDLNFCNELYANFLLDGFENRL